MMAILEDMRRRVEVEGWKVMVLQMSRPPEVVNMLPWRMRSNIDDFPVAVKF